MTNHSAQSQSDDGKSPQSVVRLPLWVSIVVIIGVILTLAGALISRIDPMFLANAGSMTDAVQVYADYMFARNLVLAIMLLFLLAVKARRMLAGFMVLVACIQFVDAVDDLVRGAFLLVPGLLVFAIVFAIGAGRLFGRPIWNVDVWRESENV